jgi:hypothetical protein
MSTNRTKIDWAYKQAQKLIVLTRTGPADNVLTRQVAAVLRRAHRRGVRAAKVFNSSRTARARVFTNDCPHGLTDSYQCGECAIERY